MYPSVSRFPDCLPVMAWVLVQEGTEPIKKKFHLQRFPRKIYGKSNNNNIFTGWMPNLVCRTMRVSQWQNVIQSGLATARDDGGASGDNWNS